MIAPHRDVRSVSAPATHPSGAAGAGSDFFPMDTTVDMDPSTAWDLGGTTQHIANLVPASYADKIHTYNGTLVVGSAIYNVVGNITGAVQGTVVAGENEERQRAFSTDSQRAKIDDGGTAQLDALAVYPHAGALTLHTPACASDFIVTRGACQP
jgi:hypothetical protein